MMKQVLRFHDLSPRVEVFCSTCKYREVHLRVRSICTIDGKTLDIGKGVEAFLTDSQMW